MTELTLSFYHILKGLLDEDEAADWILAFFSAFHSFSLTRELLSSLVSSPLGLTSFFHPRQIRARRKKMETGITSLSLKPERHSSPR